MELRRRNAALRLQNMLRASILQTPTTDRPCPTEDTDGGSASIGQLVHTQFSRRQPKRMVRLHHETHSSVAIQKIQRGVFARQMLSSKREFVNLQRAAGQIQQLVMRWQASYHSAAISALNTVEDTCARCATCRPSVFVFDLQQVLCTNCVTAMTTAMSHQRESLRTRGRFLGTMIPLSLKRTLDPRVACLQRWWQLRASKIAVSERGCCANCHRTATHIDHSSKKRLCGLCALYMRRLNNLHLNSRRVQTLAQFEADVTAATVIQALWLSWRTTRRWQAIKEVTFTRATLFATRAQSVFRGNISRLAIHACMKTLVWLCRAASGLLQTKPGSWFVCLCGDLLARVPVFLVGRECWRLAGEPHALGNEVAFRLLHDAVAGQITRVGRGWVSRCKARRGKLGRRKKLQAARCHQSSLINSCRTIQRFLTAQKSNLGSSRPAFTRRQ